MALTLAPASALWLLIAALPISLYVAFNDMKSMKIPNLAVGALVAGYAILGLFAFEFTTYLWQYLQLIVVLVVGIVLNAAGVMGAGDAKFAAAAAPYILISDALALSWIFAACIMIGFATHRIAKHTALRRIVPEWESWTSGRRFPMGLPLGMTLITYLFLAMISA